MSNKILFVVAFIIILLVSLASALAVQEDFYAYSDKEIISACACSVAENIINVKNIGDVTSTYSISSEGEIADWVSYAPTDFYLESGQSKEIFNYINVPCDAREDYSLTTSVKTLFGMEKIMEQQLKVRNCQNVLLIPTNYKQNSCPCSPVTYGIEVRNTGDFTESYRLNITPYSEYASLSTDFLIIEPGMNATVYVYMNFPCDVFGEKSFNFEAFAEGSGMLGEVELIDNIGACYDFATYLDSEFEVCQNTNNSFDITLSNLADIGNLYTFELKAPEWVSLSNESIFLWGNSSTLNRLLVSPLGIEEGKYNISLDVIAERGSLYQSLQSKAKVDVCYAVNTSLEEIGDSVNCEYRRQELEIKNQGTKSDSYRVDVGGPGWVYTLDSGNISINSGESRKVSIIQNVPCNASGEFPINITVSSENFRNVMSEVKRDIIVITEDEAYKPEIESEFDKLSYVYGAVPIHITSIGIRDSEYLLSTEAPEWMWLNSSSIFVPQGETGIIYLMYSPNESVEEGKYIVTLFASPKDTGVTYTKEIVLKLSSTPWYIYLYLLIPLVILLGVLTALMILMSRSKKKEKYKVEEVKPKKKRPWLKWVIIGGIILALIAAILTASFLTDQGENETLNETKAIDALMVVNRTGFMGFGNDIVVEYTDKKIYVPTETIIPLTLLNTEDEILEYSINVNESVPWIKLSKTSVRVEPNSAKTINLIVTPDESTKEGIYTVEITANIKDGGEYKQIINLHIKKKIPFYKTYIAYLLYALILLVLGVLGSEYLRRRVKKMPAKRRTEVIITKETKKKALKWLPILGIIILFIAAIWLITVTGGQSPDIPLNDSEEEANDSEQKLTSAVEFIEDLEPEEEPEPEPEVEATELAEEHIYSIMVNRSGIEGRKNVLRLEKWLPVEVPIIITNIFNETLDFAINLNENLSWVNLSITEFSIDPDESKTIKLEITPVEDEDMQLDLSVSVINDKIYTEVVSLIVSVKPESRFVSSYLWWFLISLILLALIILGMHLRESLGDRISGIHITKAKSKKFKYDGTMTKIRLGKKKSSF